MIKINDARIDLTSPLPLGRVLAVLSIDTPFVMAGEDTVVPVTTLSRCYSERIIDHATDFRESRHVRSSFTFPSHSQPHQLRSFAFRKRSFGKKAIVWRAF